MTKAFPTARSAIISACCIACMLCTFSLAAEVELDGHRFTLPDGLEIELAAGPPLVDRPICADFDEQGRLYVAESSGSNDDVETQLDQKPHRILRLEDTDGDGRFDRRVVFADQMMFPEGALWHAGSLYVSAPPSIWKLTDTDGDGVCDQREEWMQGKTLTGCANDLHGPYLGLDGLIYWCKGAFAQQTYERPGKTPFTTRAAHIFRRRAGGGAIEPVMTGGMDNPVEVVFSPGGERFFTTTFVQHPGGGKRDGLIHAVYGGVYGKIHSPIDEHPRTGEVMPVMVHFGPAAPCGLLRLESVALGSEYQGSVLACLFNLRKLTRHVLEPEGATFRSTDSDFLVSNNIDFHPTDVLEDSDGSVLVVNTGGWYKLCCPSSQLWKPDVLGAIYRVRRTGAARVEDPRGLKLDWDGLDVAKLVTLLGDPRHAVRQRAIAQLANLGEKAVPALAPVATKAADRELRLRAVWTLTRIDAPAARAAVRVALADPDEEVRQAALHSAGLWRDAQAAQKVAELLRSPSMQSRRAAAEALGRIGDEKSIASLLAAADEPSDRVLEHSLTFALIELDKPAAVRAQLASGSPRVQHVAIVALDQMPSGNLTTADVRLFLDAEDGQLREAAWWIAKRHPEWAGELAGYFRTKLGEVGGNGEAAASLTDRLSAFAGAPEIQTLIAESLSDSKLPRDTKLALLDVIARTGQEQLPDVWATALAPVLATGDTALIERAVRALGAFEKRSENEALAARLVALAAEQRIEPALRVEALAVAQQPSIDEPTVQFLCSQIGVDQQPRLRARAVDVLLAAKLTGPELTAVAEALSAAGPMELDRLLAVFKDVNDDALGQTIADSLEECPATASLDPEDIARLPIAMGHAETLINIVMARNGEKLAMLKDVSDSIAEGDIRRGQQVFMSTKAACISCHEMGYVGGHVGPDLTNIGRIRTERDLAEAILFPSASFVRSFEPTVITTLDGHNYNGIVRDEARGEVILSLDAEKTVRIPHADIETREPSAVSVMPAGLEKQLTRQELIDLVTFLRAAQ